MIGEDHLHIIETEARIDLCSTSYFSVPVAEKTSIQTKNVLF